MNSPLVSILIPCYNAAPWLGEALRSAHEQSWKNLEIIVVDDGSTDGNLALSRQSALTPCRVVRQERRGASSARNHAFQLSRGDYIQYLDADDFLAPDKVERQLQALASAKPGTLSFGSIEHLYEPRWDGEDSLRVREEAVAESDDPIEFLLQLWGAEGPIEMVQTGQWLTPRALIEEAGPWNEALSVDDDGEFFARVALAASRIVAVPAALAYYRKLRRGMNLSALGRRTEAGLWSALQAAELKSKHLLERCSEERARRIVRRLITREIVHAYPAYPEVVREGESFLQEEGLELAPVNGGSPWFQRLNRVIGWKATRWMQWNLGTWKQTSPEDKNGQAAGPNG